MNEKRVYLGLPGETPRKELFFKTSEPASEVGVNSSPFNNRTQTASILKTAASFDEGRPKTSRGKAYPTPDEFTDYVVPSPTLERKGGPIGFTHDDGIYLVESLETASEASTGAIEIEEPREPYSYDDIIQLGCWLFGSGIKV